MKWLAVLLVLAPGLAGAQECPFAGQRPMLVVRMYFGQSLKGRGLVSHRAWQGFVADTVTPALPDGFTSYAASEQFVERATGGIGREPTEVVEVAADDTAGFRARVAGVMEAYRRRFDQGSVGVVSVAGCGGF